MKVKGSGKQAEKIDHLKTIEFVMTAKKILISLFFIAITFSDFAFAQSNCNAAYINSNELLELVPGKTDASNAIKQLNQKYKDELSYMQNDYNSKYTDFLSNQNNLAESIKLRRMQELYELEQNINRFMKIAQEDIDSQEAQLIVPLREKLNTAIEEVGIEQGFACIYDKANPSIAFVTPLAVDANPLVKEKLRKIRK